MTATSALRSETEASYDEIIYESFSYPQTHPQHLYTIASLFGLTPPDLRTARVLELGCAGGGNLFPQAMAFPKARFTGIDLSGEQIDIALRHAEELGLGNVTFRREDLADFPVDKHSEAFDYIICHGVYSWVPDAVRETILELCARCLSPHGLALISYNTLPGWNAVRSLREMMLYHVARFRAPAEKIAQARALLEFLLENVPAERTGYRATIEEELALLKKTNDSYLFHEHLELDNRQFYFNEFAGAANAHGLGYVGDAALSSMFVGNLKPGAIEKLQGVSDVVSQEQYMDFINNRRFRSSILSKQARQANRKLANEKILEFYVSADMKPQAPQPDPKKPVVFALGSGQSFTTHNEMTSTVYLELAASGQKPVKAADLVKRAQKKLKLKSPAEVEKAFADTALQMVLRGYLNIHSTSAEFTTTVSARPRSAPLARYQAGLKNCKAVTSQLGATVVIDLLTASCLALADGTRTVGDMTAALTADAEAGRINVHKEGRRLTDEADIRAELEPQIRATLARCAQQALLVE